MINHKKKKKTVRGIGNENDNELKPQSQQWAICCLLGGLLKVVHEEHCWSETIIPLIRHHIE